MPSTPLSLCPRALLALLLPLAITGCIAESGDPLAEATDAEAPDSSDAAPDPEPEATCLPQADDCPPGEYCQYEDGRLRCVPEGDVAPDPQWHRLPACPDGRCSRGGICMPYDFSDDPVCYHPCGPEVDCVNGRHTCRPVYDADGVDLGFGLCNY